MTLAAPAIDRFRASFQGETVVPDDPGYDDARRVWSALHDRRPAIVVRPTTVDDVASAIRLGRDHDLAIAVRSGGHSINGFSTCDDGMVIDLSKLRGVTVDPAARLARANGGAQLSELDRAAQAHGLVCPVGTVGHTGLGGLVLGGGVGRLQRSYGLTLDNLTAVELVTADGRHVRASDDENPDLFWAIRGAGPNFGVVTAFELRVHPFGPNLVRGIRIYRPADAVPVWQAFRRLLETAPRQLGLSYVVARAIPEEEYPPEVAGGPIVIVALSYNGPEDDARAALAPLSSATDPVFEELGAKRYLDIQGTYDEAYDWGMRYYCAGGFANDLQPRTVEALVAHAADALGDAGFSATGQGGAVAELAEDATAFAGRSAWLRLMSECGWRDPADDDAIMDWCRRAWSIAVPEAIEGRYVNEVFENGTDPATIYGREKLERLTALKRVWDPDNVFSLNHNIRPDGQSG